MTVTRNKCVVSAILAVVAWATAWEGRVPLAQGATNAEQEAYKQQQQFFLAIQRGNPDTVLDLLHDNLRTEVDRPVLHAWMLAVKEHLGDVQRISKEELRGVFKQDTQGGKTIRVLQSRAKAIFSKGTAHCDLWIHEGKIIRFEVTSDKIPDAWIKELQDTELYRQEGAAFLKTLLEGDDEAAYGLEHETLRKVMSRKKLKELADEARVHVGELKKVTWKSEEFDIQPQKYRLKIRYKVECEKESTEAVLTYQFLKMEGWIVGFDLTGKQK